MGRETDALRLFIRRKEETNMAMRYNNRIVIICVQVCTCVKQNLEKFLVCDMHHAMIHLRHRSCEAMLAKRELHKAIMV